MVKSLSRHSLSLLILALVFLESAPQLKADTIYTNFGSSQSVELQVWTIDNEGLDNDVVRAFSFVPTETATSTDAILALVKPSNNKASPAISVYIESSAGGEPGIILGSLTQVGNVSSQLLSDQVEFTCASCPVLQAGTTYWIVAFESSTDSGVEWLSSPFDVVPPQYANLTGSPTGPWTRLNSSGLDNRNAAFEIDGTPLPSTVPEPPILLMFCSGLTGLLIIGLRRFAGNLR